MVLSVLVSTPKAALYTDCSPIPVFCFLYSKIFPVTKMRLNVCFNKMALFGLFAALIKGCSSYGTTVVNICKKYIQTVRHACRKTSRHHSTVDANIRVLCKPAAVTTFVLREGICDLT